MTVRHSCAHPLLNLYHQHQGLLFQFILSSFLSMEMEMRPLRKNPSKDALEQIFRKLIGASQHRFFAWNRDIKHLSKLKLFATLYVPLTGGEKGAMELQSCVDQMWLLCMQGVDLLADDKIVAKLLSSLDHMERALIPQFELYKDDENVLFYILRHRAQIDEIYGTAKILARIYPEGLTHLENFLIERYKRRMFDHLVPIIKAHIAQLS